MSEVKIDAARLEEAVKAKLEAYERTVYTETRKAVDETAREAKEKTASKSPRSASGSKHYYKGWASKTVSDNSLRYEAAVYNKTKPGLTHLLEHGHAGPAPAAAHPHIITDEEVREIFLRKFKL